MGVCEAVHESRVLHDGWEMDNRVWVTGNEVNGFTAMTTNHGSECEMDLEEIDLKIEETKASLEGLEAVRKLITK